VADQALPGLFGLDKQRHAVVAAEAEAEEVGVRLAALGGKQQPGRSVELDDDLQSGGG
jgi:hypothetical protein